MAAILSGRLRPLAEVAPNVRLPRPTMPKPTLAALGEDAFVGRVYRTTGLAEVGRGLDNASRNGIAVRQDLALAQRGDLHPKLRLAAMSKALAETEWTVCGGEAVARGVRDLTHTKASPAPSQGLACLHRAGAVGTVALAVFTMPEMTEQAAFKTIKAVRASRDPHSGRDSRRQAWKSAAYADAALLSVGSAITGSIQTLAQTGSVASPLTRSAQVITNMDAFTIVDRASRIVAPVADVALTVADAINLHDVLSRPQATTGQKARAWFNVGIDVVKLASYCAPKSAAAKVAHGAAGLAQLGLVVWDRTHGK